MNARDTIALALAAVALAITMTALATRGEALLPVLMRGHVYVPGYGLTVTLVWLATLAALFTLWRKNRKTVLDVWLMVVMCAWTFDVALSAVLNAGRFDLGFYGGRIFGLLAASFVLWILLFESMSLYRRLAIANRVELEIQIAQESETGCG